MQQARPRISLSGLEFRVLSKEVSSALAGTYVSNIYSIGESQLLRMRKQGGGEESLVLSPKLGSWITERPARVETTAFTTALRSLLLRERLEGASQVDLDRVLVLRFEARGEEKAGSELVLELMPPGNVVVVGPDGRVTLALREVREGRRVSKGHPYAPPAQTRASIDSLTRAELAGALAKEKTLGRALGRGLSLPRRYVDEILARASYGQDDPAAVGDAGVDALMAAVKGLLETIEERPSPCLVRGEGGSLEVMVVRPTGKEVVESSQTLSKLLDGLLFPELLASEEQEAQRRDGDDAHERRAEELAATIEGLEAKKAGLEKRSAELRELASAVRSAPGLGEAMEAARAGALPKDLASELDRLASKGQASVSSAIFDGAKSAQSEAKEIEEALKEVRSKLRKEAGKTRGQKAKAVPLSRAKKEWYERFRWFVTTGGRLAIGGRDAQSNTTLVRRHMQDGDTVFHADLFGSPFFVLKGGSEQSAEEVREVAKATVAFSSAWKTGLGAADAYWVEPGQVATAGPSGEYLAHGSFAIKGKKNFVTKSPVELAVGIDDRGRVVSGPEEAIMRVARGHVALIPSRDKPSDTAKKVLHELSPYAKPGVSLGVDDVLRMLPAGGGKIVRRRADGGTEAT